MPFGDVTDAQRRAAEADANNYNIRQQQQALLAPVVQVASPEEKLFKDYANFLVVQHLFTVQELGQKEPVVLHLFNVFCTAMLEDIDNWKNSFHTSHTLNNYFRINGSSTGESIFDKDSTCHHVVTLWCSAIHHGRSSTQNVGLTKLCGKSPKADASWVKTAAQLFTGSLIRIAAGDAHPGFEQTFQPLIPKLFKDLVVPSKRTSFEGALCTVIARWWGRICGQDRVSAQMNRNKKRLPPVEEVEKDSVEPMSKNKIQCYLYCFCFIAQILFYRSKMFIFALKFFVPPNVPLFTKTVPQVSRLRPALVPPTVPPTVPPNVPPGVPFVPPPPFPVFSVCRIFPNIAPFHLNTVIHHTSIQ